MEEEEDQYPIEWVESDGEEYSVQNIDHPDDEQQLIDDEDDGTYVIDENGDVIVEQYHDITSKVHGQEEEEEHDDDDDDGEYFVGDEIIPSTEMTAIQSSLDHMAAENLIYMAQDGNKVTVTAMGDLIEQEVEEADNANYNTSDMHNVYHVRTVLPDDSNIFIDHNDMDVVGECVVAGSEDVIEVNVDQLGREVDVGDMIEEELVPLPTDQDTYTSLRPFPCDFCSRRFRKKQNLMNHMIAHKNDRPHICNLCGARYFHRADLLNHLKSHATDGDEYIIPEPAKESMKMVRRPVKSRKPAVKTVKKPKVEKYYNQEEQDLMEAAEQSYENQRTQQSEIAEVRYPIFDPSRPFVCQTCGVSFAREKALLSHSRMHAGDCPYECDNCSEMFWDVKQLHDHQKLHHTAIVDNNSSENSEYEPEKDGKEEETETDEESKYGDYFCNICGLSFHRMDLLKRHKKCHVKNEQPETGMYPYDEDGNERHTCSVCGETFTGALDLLAHAEIHTRMDMHKCLLCGETFFDETSIKKHIQTIHNHELTDRTCRICGKHCKDPRTLMKHSWEHSREKNHSCSKCGKTFHNKARLKRHMQSHRNKSVSCEVCGEFFEDGRSLMNHRHSHTNVSGRQFPCRNCGKTFGSRSSQQIHMRIHTGERPYGCRFCWKAFADGGTLRKHERIHTGEKPYACPVCPKAFNQRVVLREHIRSHHSGPDNKYGNVGTPYYCAVCSESFEVADQLITHLIEHSDMNTAMKRQPVAGPRKYKRRRKLKPHELERLNASKNTDEEEDDEKHDVTTVGKSVHTETSTIDEDEYYATDKSHSATDQSELLVTKSPQRPVTGRPKNLSFSDDQYNSMFNNIDAALSSIEPICPNATNRKSPTTKVNNSTSSGGVGNRKVVNRGKQLGSKSGPKMIHTQKTRVPTEYGKRKTKTLITRTASSKEQRPTKTDNRIKSSTVSSSTMIRNDYLIEPPKQLTETDILLELTRKNNKFSPDVVNDLEEILRSPIKKQRDDEYIIAGDVKELLLSPKIERPLNDDLPKMRRSKRSTAGVPRNVAATITKRDSNGMGGKRPVKERKSDDRNQPSESDDYYPQVFIKQEKEESYSSDEVFTCEMCSAVFRDRAQLLVHVPVHI